MGIYCINSFKDAFDDLIKKKPYKALEADLIEYFFERATDAVLSGTRLNGSQTEPYIKKRLEGSGGYRVYYLVKITDENIYLMFVHPKTGPNGSDNITDESKAKIYKEVLESIKTNNLYGLSLNTEKTRIQFKKK